jgi:hypothetical protein
LAHGVLLANLIVTSNSFENLTVTTLSWFILVLFDNSGVILAAGLVSLFVEGDRGQLLTSLEEGDQLFGRHFLTELVSGSALLDGANERLGVETAQVDGHEELLFKLVLVLGVTRLDQILSSVFFADSSLWLTVSTTHCLFKLFIIKITGGCIL